MENLKKVIESRRSYYNISGKSPISNAEIKKLIDCAVQHVPSAFNSQTSRLVLLLNDNHKKLWNIVKSEIRKRVSDEAYQGSKAKIGNSFEAGYGTVLFYEDMSIVKALQNQFPTYSDNFPVWAEHASAMQQYAVWTLLEKAGFGASLQHYNPLIDVEVAKEWNINPDWKLIAQMPFGIPISDPGAKEFQPIEHRSIMFE